MTRFRPSFALVVAMLALAIAISGTAYSASKVSGNSLIKPHSLSGNRLKPDSVSGVQVNENTLGTVPNAGNAANASHAAAANHANNADHATTAGSAANANHASSADSVPKPALTPFAYGPGWETDTTFTSRAAGYRVDAGGLVHLQGMVTRTSGSATTILTLPAGVRGTNYIYFPVYTKNTVPGGVYLTSAGDLILFSGDASFVSLEGITFYPDN